MKLKITEECLIGGTKYSANDVADFNSVDARTLKLFNLAVDFQEEAAVESVDPMVDSQPEPEVDQNETEETSDPLAEALDDVNSKSKKGK